MAVLALATAIGGGVIRDVLLGYFPPNSLRNVVYVTVVLVVTFIVFAIYNSRYHRNIMGPRSRASYLFADALGLASFTVTVPLQGIHYIRTCLYSSYCLVPLPL